MIELSGAPAIDSMANGAVGAKAASNVIGIGCTLIIGLVAGITFGWRLAVNATGRVAKATIRGIVSTGQWKRGSVLEGRKVALPRRYRQTVALRTVRRKARAVMVWIGSRDVGLTMAAVAIKRSLGILSPRMALLAILDSVGAH